jgi:predicted DNA-binding antitoxin AbrB/MazE fold protein
MTTTVDAIYEHGKLVLPRPLSLPEKSHVRVTIESDPERDDAFNGLLLSESALAKDWNTPEEDAAWASL